jgi:hypothetical protein
MFNKKIAMLPLMLAVVSLTACKDSSNNSSGNDHQAPDLDTGNKGRLVISSANTAEVAVINLKDGSEIERISLNNAASGVYSSPQHRFALVAQRDQGEVQIIDGGLYQEDHGDHLHPYEKDPSLIAKTFNGAKPTHYREHEGQAAFFFDGDSEQALLSKVIAFNDEAILHNEERSLELDNAMHGVAEPRDEYLLATYRPAEAVSVLPDQVELYKFNTASASYDLVEKFDENCPGLHGAFSTEEASVFGCSDGILMITQVGETFTASKIANPDSMAEGERIGSFSGHADGHIIAGWASGKLYQLDIDAASLTLVDWTQGEQVEYSTAKMDDEGEVLLVLDNTGTVHLLDAENNFARLDTIKVIEGMPELTGHSRVAIATNYANEEAYFVDSVAQKIVVIDVEERHLEGSIDLTFTPKALAWVGIAGEGHDHEHDHDEEHDEDHDH